MNFFIFFNFFHFPKKKNPEKENLPVPAQGVVPPTFQLVRRMPCHNTTKTFGMYTRQMWLLNPALATPLFPRWHAFLRTRSQGHKAVFSPNCFRPQTEITCLKAHSSKHHASVIVLALSARFFFWSLHSNQTCLTIKTCFNGKKHPYIQSGSVCLYPSGVQTSLHFL